MATQYLDRPEQWAAVCEYARKAGRMGLDTETYGHNVKESTPAYRAKIHVWSIAFATSAASPRGYHQARGAVLPAAALGFAGFASVLADPGVVKVAHNVHHDQHALANHGLALSGIVDTLDLVRLAYPERSLDVRLGFRLKPLARDILGKPARDEYDDIVNDVELVSKWVDKVSCLCGEPKCRKRREPEHTKIHELVEKVTEKPIVYPLESVVPGHKKWERLVEYAGADAVDALELEEMAQRKLTGMESRLPEVPW